jgi:hypothetical protein
MGGKSRGGGGMASLQPAPGDNEQVAAEKRRRLAQPELEPLSKGITIDEALAARKQPPPIEPTPQPELRSAPVGMSAFLPTSPLLADTIGTAPLGIKTFSPFDTRRAYKETS